MKSLEIKPESEIKSVENERAKIIDAIKKSLIKLEKNSEKYDFLGEKYAQIEFDHANGESNKVFEALKSFFVGINHDKIDPADKQSILVDCGQIIQQLEVATIYTELKEHYAKLANETTKSKQDEIIQNIQNLKQELKQTKASDYKNTIINNLEETMATGNKGPGNNNFGNRGGGGFRPGDLEEWKEVEKTKAQIAKEIKDHEFDLEEKRNKLKNPPEDPVKKEKSSLNEIAEKEAHGEPLSAEEEDLKKKHPILYKKELAKHLDATKESEDMVNEIAMALILGKKLTGEQKVFLKESVNKDLVDAEKTKLEKEAKDLEAEIESIAEKLANGIKPAKLGIAEKKIYAAHKDAIELKIEDFNDDLSKKKDRIISDISDLVAENRALSGSQQMQFKKYETEILEAAKDKISKNKLNHQTIKEIALAEVDGVALTDEQDLHTRIPGERAKIATEKAKIVAERLEEDRIANLLVAADVLTDPADQNFYNKNKDAIDAKVVKFKAERIETLKKSIIDKALYNGVLTKEEEDIYNANKEEFDPKIMDALKLDLQAATAAGDTLRVDSTKKIIESRIRLSLKSKEEYEPLIKRFKETNERIIALEAKDKLITGEAELLVALKNEKSEIYASLDKLGPAGRGYADLEVARNDLAKKSQEFQKSFVNKFPGSKIVGVMAGMFGSKWSAVKEGEQTPAMQEKMRNAQLEYNKVKERLMNTFIGEEYSVREAFGQDLKNLSTQDEATMIEFLKKTNKEFISDEYKKLDDAKNVTEGTVRGSAMRRFADWYSKGGPYKNVKNPLTRKILNRVTSGAILGAGLFLVPGIGAGAAFGSYMGYRAARAVASATVGESLAMGVATAYGGKLNDKGEFEKFANKRDAEFLKSDEESAKLMIERLKKEERPLMTPTMMQKLNEDHAKAVGNYMNSSGNARRAEMWTRLIAGGATAWSMTQLLPNPVPVGIPGPNPDHTPVPGPAPIIEPVPGPENLVLEGISTEASAQGSISTFMKLKEMMIDKYMNDGRFAGLSRDEIAQKMIDEGNLDPFAEEIMGSKSLTDFTNLAERRGFWDPSGAGNPNVDSASVPKGSIIGLETGTDGELHYFIDTPNGERMELSKFGEIANTQRGVGLIDTDGSMRAPSSVGSGELPPPDSSLDATDDFEIPRPGAGTASGRETTMYSGSNPNIENLNGSGSIDEQIAKYRKYEYPGDEHSYYLSKGFNEKGLQGTMRGSNPDVTTEYYDDTGNNYYYTEKAALYEKFRGTEHDIKNSSMYREYHSKLDRYNFAQDQISKLENAKLAALRAETEAMMTPDTGNSVSDLTPEQIATENKILEDAVTRNNKLVDEAFGKKPIFGKDVEGIKTDAWNEFKDDTMSEHIAKSGRATDDVYGPSNSNEPNFTGTRKEVNFLEKLYEKSTRLKIAPFEDETVEQFANRVALEESKRSASSK